LLGPQAVDERVDEGREVVTGWEEVWGDTRVFCGEFGGPVDSFIGPGAQMKVTLRLGGRGVD